VYLDHHTQQNIGPIVDTAPNLPRTAIVYA
jgi:hypothetical protein